MARRHEPLLALHCSLLAARPLPILPLPTVSIDCPESAPETAERPGGGEEDVDMLADVDAA
jgi:hypothetical protein